jgi:radical SAM superfamily enzyme
MGEALDNLLLAPSWTRKKNEVLAAIYREFGET